MKIELDRLAYKSLSELYDTDVFALSEQIKTARAEAITEFAERLKASLNDVARWQMHGDKNEYFIIGKPFIDEIAKEMKEEPHDNL